MSMSNANSSVKKFSTREIYFYNMINNFYRQCNIDCVNTMVDIVNGENIISLRILDWFVTKYANKNKILINNDGDIIDVHISYKAQLKSYKKKYFDPFKRREKFNYHFKEADKTIYTTIGQLNFFRWAMENGILAYVISNYDTLSKEMNVSNKNDKRRKKDKTSTKIIDGNNIDNKIGINVSKKIENEQVKIILTFN